MARDEMPDDVKRMRTSDLIAALVAPMPSFGGGRLGYRRTDAERDAMERARVRRRCFYAELDARIPPRVA